MNPGDKEAEQKFKEASEAYAVLSDPDKRRQYDQFGHAAFEQAQAAEQAASTASISVEIWAIFSAISFGDLFGGGRRRSGGATTVRCREPICVPASASPLRRPVFGCEKEIELNMKDECTTCHGTGAKPGTSPETCPKCGGKGQVVLHAAVSVRYGSERADLSGLSRYR